jgi:TorA maturation chaperone TorD
LRDVPDEALLDRVNRLDAPAWRDAFALAWDGLRLAGAQVTAAEVDDEYHRLFIGLGRGELVPYGSWYQTGFLMEQPLGALRRDLAALGFEREPGVHEPEDHVAALCEVMGQLAVDPEMPVERQRDFYRAHLGPWVARFCRDLEGVPGAPLYGAIGRLGAAFFEIEGRYLEMEG